MRFRQARRGTGDLGAINLARELGFCRRKPPAVARKPARIIGGVIQPERPHALPTVQKRLCQTAAGILVLKTDTADELCPAKEFRRPNRALLGTFDQQHPAQHACGRKRKQQPAAGTQCIEPRVGWLGRTGTNVDQICFWQIRRNARPGLNIYLRQAFQIVARASARLSSIS